MLNKFSHQDEPEWLEDRRASVGASDIVRIMNGDGLPVQLSKWAEGDGITETEAMRWGKRLETPIIEGAAIEFGLPLHPFGWIVRDDARPFMHATPDARLTGAADSQGRFHLDGPFVQIKLNSRHKGWENEQVPMDYYVQQQHELAVTGDDHCELIALIGGRLALERRTIERDERVIDEIKGISEAFMLATRDHEPWAATGSDACKKALTTLYKEVKPGVVVDLPADFIDLDAELEAIKGDMKDCKDRRDEIENSIREKIGDAEAGQVPGGPLYTWKSSERKGYVVKPSTTRTLRRTKARRIGGDR